MVTGATAGFGREIARRFASEGHHLIITGRRKHLLTELAVELAALPGVETLPLCFDVRSRKEVEEAIGGLTGKWRDIDILVNNAGLAAGLSPIHEGSMDDWDQMIDTNVKGLLYLTRSVAPIMVARKQGHIINIGSIAGKEVYPMGNVYCGSKFAVDAITRGTRIDLVTHGIKVTQIAPGAAKTEFSLVRFKGDRERADSVYNGFQPLLAEDIAEAVYYVTTLPPHVNVNEMVLMPTAQASSTTFHRRSQA